MMNFNGPIIYNVERGGKVKGFIELLFFGNVYHAARRRLSGRYWWPCKRSTQGLKSVVSVLLHSYLQSIYPRSWFVYVWKRIIQTENFLAKLFHRKTFQTTRVLLRRTIKGVINRRTLKGPWTMWLVFK